MPTIALQKPIDDFSNSSKVVLSLINRLYSNSYVIVDNLYTFPELFRKLCQHRADSFGTLTKKKGLPDGLWLWKPKKGMLIEPMKKFCDRKFVASAGVTLTKAKVLKQYL